MIRNTFYILLEKAARFIYAFVLIPIVANHIGAEAFSIYVSVLSHAALLSFFYNLGLDKAQLSGYLNYLGFRAIVNARIVGFLVYSLVNTIYFLGYSSSDSNILSLFMVLFIGFRFSQTYDFKWHSELKSKTNTIIKVIALLVLFIIVYAEILFSIHSNIIILTLTLENLLVLIIQVKKLKLNWFRISFRQWFQVVISARYFVLANLSSLIYLKSDVLIVKSRFTSIEAAQYGAMLRLVEPFTAIAMAFSTALIARNVKKSGLFGYKPIIFVAFLGLICSVALFIGSENLVDLIYSKDYKYSGELLKWYSWTILLVFVKNSSWTFFIEKRLVKVVTLSNLISALLYVILVFSTGLVKSPLEMTKITLIVYSISTVIAPVIIFFIYTKYDKKIQKNCNA